MLHPLLLNKLQRLLPRDHINRTSLLPEANTVALLGHVQHLRTESCADELAVSRVRDGLEHLCDGRSVLCIKVGVDFVEEVEGCWVASLDGED